MLSGMSSRMLLTDITEASSIESWIISFNGLLYESKGLQNGNER